MNQKSTVLGVVLLGFVGYAGYKELSVPPLHPWHGAGLSVFLLLAVALILNDDARILAFLKGLGDIALPWKKPSP